MLKTFWMLAALSMLIALPSVQGQEYSVEVIQQGPDAEEVSADLVGVISDRGYRIKSGSRTTAEIWLCKQWQVDPSFEKSMQRLYPFQPGDLIGMLHFSRRGSDFRDQQMSSGWYTLRFALQPIDGNHIGTSPTRDFLVMVDASEDAADKDWGEDDLNEASAGAAGSAHPAMICLQAPRESGEAPSIRHDEANDWWILRAQGTGIGADGKAMELPIEMVVAGHALE
jgi:hypothetical protein